MPIHILYSILGNINCINYKCRLCRLSFPQLKQICFRFTSLGARPVYICGQLVYSVGMVVLAASRHPVTVILLSPCAGIMYATLFTMPYLIVAHYHSSGRVCVNIENYTDFLHGTFSELSILIAFAEILVIRTNMFFFSVNIFRKPGFTPLGKKETIVMYIEDRGK